MAVDGLKGLTAQDRANWEKKYSTYLSGKSSDEIERMYRNEMFKVRFKGREDYDVLKQMSPEERDAFYNESYTDSVQLIKSNVGNINDADLYSVRSDATRVYTPINEDLSVSLNEQEVFKAKSRVFDASMRKYDSEYAESAYHRDHAIKDIRNVADIISPYYKKYKNTDYLPFTDNDWQSMATEYNARRDTYGEDMANTWLQDKIQDTASKNQSILEKAWNGFAGIGSSAAGALIGVAGMLKGVSDYIIGNYENVEGLSGFENFINTIMDNDITRYGNDIITYGTIFGLEEAKKYGLSNIEVIQTSGQQKGSDSLFDQIFNVNTIPVAMQSSGFTVASMLTGYGQAKVAGWAFKGLKGATMLGKTGNTTQKLMQARNMLNSIQKAENFTNRFIIPGLTGTTEGVIEGLNTKLEVLEDSKKSIAESQSKYVDEKFNEIMELNPDMDPNIAYQLAWDEYLPKYKESLEQAEFVASKAGVNNFLVNSAINGIINQTLKAGLQSPVVQGALQKSRLFNWVTPKGKFNVSGSGNTITVTPKYNFWKKAWNIGKEPIGELTEEYLQSVSDATMSGGASHNIHQFIENKYNGDGSAEIGDYMAGDFTAALKAMGESMIDNETIKSGIYGAISSALGVPVIRNRDYTKRVKGNDGKYHTEIDFSRRENESRLGYITRLIPWRSSITNSIRENADIERHLYDEAKTLESWLRDPNNRAKFDGVVGTYNWAKQMESDAKSNDEFGYRNSLLGKTINDALMLEKMKGSAYYDSFMNELVNVANLEEGTEQANAYIKSIRDNINTRDTGVSDIKILNQLKSNANKLLNTINTIQQESSEIDRTLGNVDEDTKQALIFGQMSLQDWNNRGNTINSELDNISSSIENSRSTSNMPRNTRDIISKYGSLSKAKKIKEDLINSLHGIKKDIENLNNRKNNLTDSEKKILKEKRAKLKSINRVLNTLKDIDNIEEESVILNESEIMSLPAIDRAIMINRENLSNYSEGQRVIINNLIDKGTSKDINFYNKIQDAGRIELAKQSFLTQYNEILRDPNSFNIYVQRAKQAAADVLTKKRFESINNISNYKEFALELDKLIDNSSLREQRLIIKALSESGNTNYIKYQNDRKTIEGLLNQLIEDDAFKNIDANDADLFILSLQYLSNNGIDLNNESEVVNFLSQLDENEDSLFKKYIEEINSSSSDETKVMFTSIGEVIQTYKGVMYNYKRDENEKANNAKSIEVQPTTAEQSTPPKTVNPMPGIFSTAATSLEEANESIKKTMEEVPVTVDTASNIVLNPIGSSTISLSVEEQSILDKAIRNKDGKLLAPNGKPSKLAEVSIELYAKVRTKAFKDWFGDWENDPENASKVVDENGEPLIVYHGSPNTSIQTFSNKNKRYKVHSGGYFFVSEERIAKMYTTETGKVYSAFLNIRKMEETSAEGKDTLANLRAKENKAIENPNNDGVKMNTIDKGGKQIQYVVKTPLQIKIIFQPKEGLQSSNSSVSLESPSFINDFIENSNEEVAESAELGVKVIRNASNNYSKKAKNIAEDILNNLSNNEFENTEELSEALIKRANQLDTSADENNEDIVQVASLLRQVASKITSQAQEKKRKEKEESRKSVENSQSDTRDTSNNIFDAHPNSNSGILDSTDIQWLRDHHPDNPIIKYWDRYNIESYLKSEKLKTGKEATKVYFITDDTLAQEVKANMKSNNANYTSLDIPIIAVVEDENGPLIINNKKYQPIGTFPSSNTRSYKGVSNVERIRNLVGNQKSGELIKDKEGNILTSSLVSIVAKAPKRVPIGKPNNNAQNLAFYTLSKEDQDTLKSIPKKDRYENPTYIKMRKTFLDKLGFSKNDKYLYVNVSNLKDSVKDFRIFIRPISTTIDRNSNKSIVELFNENNVNDLLNSNSRLIKAGNILDEISSTFPNNTEVTLDRINGQLIPTGDFADRLDNISNILTRKMNNHLILSNQNWKYTILPTEEILEDGRRIFSINISDGNTTIPVGRITNGVMTPQTKFEFFRNLIMEGTQTRKINNFDFIKWQVEYPKGENAISSVMGNLANAFDDGILEMSNEGIEYEVKGIGVRSPFTSIGETIRPSEISNSNNAAPSKPVNTPTVISNDQVQSGKAIIDSETGTILKGKAEKVPNTKLDVTRTIANKIIEDSKLLELSPEGNEYINTKTGKKYSRITSIIQADAEAGERFDPNSPWILPSTNIGISVDEFVRDFFAGEFYEDGKLIGDFFYDYPNATNEQWQYFAQELQKLKNAFDAMGLTVIPRDVTVTGTLNVTDSEGKVHTIDVAGTLDLLAYDQEGNFYIYDMKTVRSSIDQHKEEKYARQLSLYKKFLENTYGISVKSLNIIPIQVEYPEPKGWKNSTNEYTVIEGNQLAINGKEYKNAKPSLFRPKELKYKESNIQYEKLTDTEKGQISKLEEMIEEKDASVDQVNSGVITSTETVKVKIEEVTVADSNEPTMDLNTGLNIGKVKDRRRKKSGIKVSSKPIRMIPSRLTWGVWENFTNDNNELININMTLEALSKFYTEEQWNQLTNEEMEHEIKCKGVFNN